MVDFNVAISTIKDNNGFVSNDKDDSFYRTYLTKGTKPIQVRISNHGTHLWTWDKNGEYIPSYAINICVVLSPNGEVDSNTVVDMNVYDNARNIVGQKKDYEVIQYVYNCTNLNAEEVHKINETIINIPTTRNFIDPFRMDVVKHANVYRLKPNQKPQLLTQPIQENNNNNKYTNNTDMKINESQLRKIIQESVKNVLVEGYINGQWYDETEPWQPSTEDEIRDEVLSQKKKRNNNYDVYRDVQDETFVFNMLKKINKNLDKVYVDIKNGDMTLLGGLVNLIEKTYEKTGDERYIICRNKMLNYIAENYNEHLFKNSKIGIDFIDVSKYKNYSPLSKDKVYDIDMENGERSSRLATVKDRKKGVNGGYGF